MKPNAEYWRATLGDVAWALRHQAEVTRQELARLIEETIDEGVPLDWGNCECGLPQGNHRC